MQAGSAWCEDRVQHEEKASADRRERRDEAGMTKERHPGGGQTYKLGRSERVGQRAFQAAAEAGAEREVHRDERGERCGDEGHPYLRI